MLSFILLAAETAATTAAAANVAADRWATEWVLLVGAITTSVISIIAALRGVSAIKAHDSRATARAREEGKVANPAVRAEDKGHV